MISIRQSVPGDLENIMSLIDSGREIMRSDGNVDQWKEGYPKRETVEHDISSGNGYLCVENGVNIGTFAFIAGPDPTYNKIYDGSWTNETLPYHVIHRIASTPGSHGVFAAIIGFALQHTNNIRIDTHRDNRIMRYNLTKHGFSYCGIIYLANGDERLAFQLVKADI